LGPSEEERTNAVNAVRLINTAEVMYSSGSHQDSLETHGRFGTWDQLNASGAVEAVRNHFDTMFDTMKDTPISSGPEIMPGWHLDILVSPDGQSYSVALHDQREGHGLYSLFTDQSGIIFFGAPMQ